MSLEIAINENTTILRELLAVLRANPASIVKPVANAVADKVTTKTTDKPAVTKTEAKVEKPAQVEQTTEDKPVVEYSQIQALVPKIAATLEGTEMVKALFGRFGVKRGPELKQEQYADFFADLQLVAAGELDPRLAEVE